MKRNQTIKLTTLFFTSVAMLVACGPNGKTSGASVNNPKHATKAEMVNERLAFFAQSASGAYDPKDAGNEEFAGRIQAAGLVVQPQGSDPTAGQTFAIHASFFVTGQTNEISATGTINTPPKMKPMLTALSNDAQTPSNYRIEAYCTGPECNNVVVRLTEVPVDTNTSTNLPTAPAADAVSAATQSAATAPPATAAKKQVVAIYMNPAMLTEAHKTAVARAKTVRKQQQTDSSDIGTPATDAAADTPASTTTSATTSGTDKSNMITMILNWISSSTGDIEPGGPVAKLMSEEAVRLKTPASSVPNAAAAPVIGADGQPVQNSATPNAPGASTAAPAASTVPVVGPNGQPVPDTSAPNSTSGATAAPAPAIPVGDAPPVAPAATNG